MSYSDSDDDIQVGVVPLDDDDETVTEEKPEEPEEPEEEEPEETNQLSGGDAAAESDSDIEVGVSPKKKKKRAPIKKGECYTNSDCPSDSGSDDDSNDADGDDAGNTSDLEKMSTPVKVVKTTSNKRKRRATTTSKSKIANGGSAAAAVALLVSSIMPASKKRKVKRVRRASTGGTGSSSKGRTKTKTPEYLRLTVSAIKKKPEIAWTFLGMDHRKNILRFNGMYNQTTGRLNTLAKHLTDMSTLLASVTAQHEGHKVAFRDYVHKLGGTFPPPRHRAKHTPRIKDTGK